LRDRSPTLLEISGNGCRLNRSMQRWPEVCSQEFESMQLTAFAISAIRIRHFERQQLPFTCSDWVIIGEVWVDGWVSPK
jgi:hypothetical protein